MKINKNGKIFTVRVSKEINSFKKGGSRKSYQDGGKTSITYNGNKYVWDRDSDKFYDTNGAEVTDSTFVSNLNNYLLEKGIASPSIEKEVSKIAIDLNNNEVAFNLNRDFKYDYIYNKKDDTFSFKDKNSNKEYKLLVNNPEADKKLRDRLKELDYDKSVSNLELSTEQDKENTSTKTNISAFPELGIIDESIRDLDTYTEKIESPNLNTKEQEDKKLEVKKTESTTDNKNIETGKVFNLPGDNTYTYMTKDGKFYYNSSSNKAWVEVTKKEAIVKLADFLTNRTDNSTDSSTTNAIFKYPTQKIDSVEHEKNVKAKNEAYINKKLLKISDGNPDLKEANGIPNKKARELFKNIQRLQGRFNIDFDEAWKKYQDAQVEIQNIAHKIHLERLKKSEKDSPYRTSHINNPNFESDLKKEAENIYYSKNPKMKFKKGGVNNIMKTYKINNKVYTIKSK